MCSPPATCPKASTEQGQAELEEQTSWAWSSFSRCVSERKLEVGPGNQGSLGDSPWNPFWQRDGDKGQKWSVEEGVAVSVRDKRGGDSELSGWRNQLSVKPVTE